ncbi:DUF3265 domain-containing protein [Vibrio alginolyticus]|nr:DUF3265 domain-containing protein [Vibrio alginolyticus]
MIQCQTKHATNNLFKSDSQRVAFLLCVAFSGKVVCGSIGIALLTP